MNTRHNRGGGPAQAHPGPRFLAMWSGPRNISTAMMRAFGNRSDTSVIDEPFYAFYLVRTGRADPGREEVIASQPTDWPDIVESITASVPENRALYYQKHITTHMLPEIPLDWLASLEHCFLIRDPASVIVSYTDKRPDGSIDDLGYRQQYRIYEYVRNELQQDPPVIDSGRFLAAPAQQLQTVCQRLDLAFQPAMLQWEPGIRPTDGIWHKHWYANVAHSSGFVSQQSRPPPSLTDDQRRMAEQCEPFYRKMLDAAIKRIS